MAETATQVAAAGDEAARLYTEYGSKLERFCRGRLRSAEEAEDAVQATFLRVYTALRQGTVPEYEAAWLYKIAHNVCLSRIESSARRARVEAPQDFAVLEESLAAPEGRGDELVGLAEALATMPPNLRQAILLREWQGLSYAEIAEALDVSVSAVETLIFRARKYLAKALVEPGKRVAGALNLPWLWNLVRSFLAGAGVATKIAAGVALVAVAGGGGADLGMAVGSTPASHPVTSIAAPTPVAASSGSGGASARMAGSSTGRARRISRISRIVTPAPLPARRHVRTRTSAAATQPAGSAGGASVPVVPGTTPTIPAPSAPPAATPTTPAAGPRPRRGTTPSPTTPAITLPAVPKLPAVTVPPLPLPLPLPTVTTPTPPAVTVPTVPAVTTPVGTVTIPPLPAVTVPTLTLP